LSLEGSAHCLNCCHEEKTWKTSQLHENKEVDKKKYSVLSVLVEIDETLEPSKGKGNQTKEEIRKNH
jgi:hypothetical protein